jgi:hypothetical protein
MHCEIAIRPELKPGSPTVCVNGAGAGVDSVWEQRKLEARKMFVNRAESPASSARFVGWRAVVQNSLAVKDSTAIYSNFINCDNLRHKFQLECCQGHENTHNHFVRLGQTRCQQL